MSRTKAIFICALAAAFLVLPGTAALAQAKLADFAGKVEVKPPNGSWTPARKGMTIAVKSIVSTGFRSRAVIDLDQSTLFVNQLTRLSLEELVRRQDVITTDIGIRAGSLAAEVKTGAAEYKHDFKVKSPVSTAAVRGTKIVYDGYEMSVTEGTAVLYNLLNQPMTVFKGDAALTGTGLDLFPSLALRSFRFGVRPGPRRILTPGSVNDSKSTSDSAIIIFYTIW